jgi:hypothetical protein
MVSEFREARLTPLSFLCSLCRVWMPNKLRWTPEFYLFETDDRNTFYPSFYPLTIDDILKCPRYRRVPPGLKYLNKFFPRHHFCLVCFNFLLDFFNWIPLNGSYERSLSDQVTSNLIQSLSLTSFSRSSYCCISLILKKQ